MMCFLIVSVLTEPKEEVMCCTSRQPLVASSTDGGKTTASRQQGLPEIEKEERGSSGGRERGITKRDNMKEDFQMKRGLAKGSKIDLGNSEINSGR